MKITLSVTGSNHDLFGDLFILSSL
jgi:hypothetical protein